MVRYSRGGASLSTLVLVAGTSRSGYSKDNQSVVFTTIIEIKKPGIPIPRIMKERAFS